MNEKKDNLPLEIETLLHNNMHTTAEDTVYQTIVDEFKIATMADTKEIYAYNGNGIYQSNGENIIHEQVAWMYGRYYKITTFNEIKSRIQGTTYTERIEFNKEINYIPVENGVLNLKTNTLEPHSEKWKFTFKIPVKYDINATCPEIEKFIEEIFHQEDIQIAYEIIAYCLWREVPIQKAVMLLGEGSNGKSVFLQLISAFLGVNNVANIPLQDLAENRFALTGLFGKLANTYPDLEETALKTTGKIKAVISGDMLPYEKKHKDIGSFEPYAKHLFSTNKLPKTRDNSFAYFRRWCIVECERKFTKELGNVDQNKIKKITTPEELSGLLNKCVMVLKNLLDNQDFTKGRTKSIELKWIRESDSIKAFITECVVKDDSNEAITKDELYQIYQKYCELFEVEVETPQEFGRDFKTFVPYANHILQKIKDDLGKEKRVKSVKGVKLIKPEFDRDTEDTEFDRDTEDTDIIHMLERKGDKYSNILNNSVSSVSQKHIVNNNIYNNILISLSSTNLTPYLMLEELFRLNLGDFEQAFKELVDQGFVYEPRKGYYLLTEKGEVRKSEQVF